ncbi:hypothetical protein [Allostreptomyces psammosilenae]|uniref:ATP-binding protein n=1 Tax=Allostreptomyces psammosilenae TaxID=1892865 RepID=A0A853A0W9_9ACTN|nr:hypothetical protein [Allostreptomyces psammosilenae]NYI08019.1 hypothetical protein [Allostreptomyces psammosilenae]
MHRTLRSAALSTSMGAALAIGTAGVAAAAPGQSSPLALTPLADQAHELVADQDVESGLDAATTYGLAPLGDLALYPLAPTPVDPLENSLGTQVADFQPVSTEAVTAPVSDGLSLGELPLLGALLGGPAA